MKPGKMLSSMAVALFLAVPYSFAQTIDLCLTTKDRSSLLEYSPGLLSFSGKPGDKNCAIIVDERQSYQQIDGFGFSMTGGSAGHLMTMDKQSRSQLLRQLFGRNPGEAGINYIRLTLGASDMNAFVFSYDDIPAGETDFDLKHFSLSQDLNDVIPIMKEVLAIAPDIKIMASPWSAPVWMKESGDIRGGKLRKDCYGVYADYMVKYVQEMGKQGIRIDALTVQNEPLNSRNTPSMPWSPQDQAEFVGKYLGPKLEAAGLNTKIVLFDHNCDRPDYPLASLLDKDADRYVTGVAYHHYMGDMSAMGHTHMARPDKDIFFTEQMTTERPGSPEINIAPAVKRLIIDVMRNWSRNSILWNLANDSMNDPHTDNGGCSMCQGAITIDEGKLTSLNIAYYVIAQIARFVPDGSVRIFSTDQNDPAINMSEDEQNPGVFRSVYISASQVLPNVAFKTPEGKIVLIVANTRSGRENVTIQYKGRYAVQTLESGSVCTFVW